MVNINIFKLIKFNDQIYLTFLSRIETIIQILFPQETRHPHLIAWTIECC